MDSFSATRIGVFHGRITAAVPSLIFEMPTGEIAQGLDVVWNHRV